MHALAWRPGHAEVATAADDGTVRLWPTDAAREARSWQVPGACRAVVFTPEGRHLLTGNDDGSLHVLRLPATGR